ARQGRSGELGVEAWAAAGADGAVDVQARPCEPAEPRVLHDGRLPGEAAVKRSRVPGMRAMSRASVSHGSHRLTPEQAKVYEDRFGLRYSAVPTIQLQQSRRVRRGNQLTERDAAVANAQHDRRRWLGRNPLKARV